MVLFHRGHEHSGRLQHIVDELAMPDTAFYAWMPEVMVAHRGNAVTARRSRVRCRMLTSLCVSPPQIARPG
jgi:alpha-beta hydrolase superfamily lysophospholipase